MPTSRAQLKKLIEAKGQKVKPVKRAKGSTENGEVSTDDYIQQTMTGTPPTDQGTTPSIARQGLDLLKQAGKTVYGNLREAVVDPAAFHKRALGNVAKQLQDDPEEFMMNWTGGGLGGVFKQKGGNWLAGNVEKKTGYLKARAASLDPEIRDMMPEDKLEELSKMPVDPRRAPEVELEKQRLVGDVALNKWIEKKLNPYIKNEMATMDDPLRKQADEWAEKQQKLLAEKDEQIARARAKQEEYRQREGVTPEMLTKSDQQIRLLERQRDEIAARRGLHFALPETNIARENALKLLRGMRGFPEEPVAASEMGKRWETLADYYLVGSSKAGEVIQPNFFFRERDAQRVYRENPWLFKVDPETVVNRINNGISQQETGFRHMVDELQNALAPNSDLPKELRLTPKDLEKKNVADIADLVDRIDAHRSANRQAAKLDSTLKADLFKEYPEQGNRWIQLNKPGQFKEESDAMGHSVRGYEPPDLGGRPDYGHGGFDAIQSGRAKVYSLRDSKGESLATIEVLSSKVGQMETPVDSITQIKGPGNSRPSPEAVPFIQDFIKSQKWYDIGDLQNADLVPLKPMLLKNAQDRGIDVDVVTYFRGDAMITKDEFNRLAGAIGGINKYANGGEVLQFIKKSSKRR